MEIIRVLLKVKGHDIWSIKPNASVYSAIELMADKDISALLVMEGEKLIGVMSERDYARKVILKGRSSRETRVEEIMTPSIISAHPDQSVKECMVLMTRNQIRHLPILEDGEICGVVSLGDLVKTIISEQELTIKNLEPFVSGEY
jgi:CBS domain-containing protein